MCCRPWCGDASSSCLCTYICAFPPATAVMELHFSPSSCKYFAAIRSIGSELAAVRRSLRNQVQSDTVVPTSGDRKQRVVCALLTWSDCRPCSSKAYTLSLTRTEKGAPDHLFGLLDRVDDVRHVLPEASSQTAHATARQLPGLQDLQVVADSEDLSRILVRTNGIGAPTEAILSCREVP